MTTLAEDIALLLIAPDTGKPLVDGTAFDRVIGGALLLDLATAGHVTVEGDGARAQVSATAQQVGDPLLDLALERLGDRGRRAKSAVEKLARRTRPATFDRLVDSGVLVREEGRFLGLIPTTTWRAADPRPRAQLHAGISAVLQGKAEPDARQAGLISLLHAVKAEHKVVDGPRRELRDRARAVADGDFAGPAVRHAIQAVQATVMAAVAASSAATAGNT